MPSPAAWPRRGGARPGRVRRVASPAACPCDRRSPAVPRKPRPSTPFRRHPTNPAAVERSPADRGCSTSMMRAAIASSPPGRVQRTRTLEAMRGEIALEARACPPVDVAGELTPGRRDRESFARRIQAREFRRVMEGAIADFASALHITLDVGASQPEQPQLRKASLGPGALLDIEMLDIHLRAELRGLPATVIAGLAQHRGKGLDLDRRSSAASPHAGASARR